MGDEFVSVHIHTLTTTQYATPINTTKDIMVVINSRASYNILSMIYMYHIVSSNVFHPSELGDFEALGIAMTLLFDLKSCVGYVVEDNTGAGPKTILIFGR